MLHNYQFQFTIHLENNIIENNIKLLQNKNNIFIKKLTLK